MTGAGGRANGGSSGRGSSRWGMLSWPSFPGPGISSAWQGGESVVMETCQLRLQDGQANSDISVWRLCMDASKIEFKESCLRKRTEGVQETI